tara:strand:+ start:575 stop:817 length:243 start_codon:yes stop_codon:yes gene_type:complete
MASYLTVQAGRERVNETLENANVSARFETMETQFWTELYESRGVWNPEKKIQIVETEIDDVQIAFTYRDIEWALAMNLGR